MTTFYLAAAALVVAALLLLLRPWWAAFRRGASADSLASAGQTSVLTLNAAIHRDRLAELERDHRNGTLSATDLAEAREELQRQLLDDTSSSEVVATAPASRRGALALALTVPLLAVGIYLLLGSPFAVLPGDVQAQRATADMEQLVVKLEKKLQQNPDNPEGWAMLGRSYKSMQRWDDAERAFTRIGPDLDKSAELLAELAELLVQKHNGFSERPRQLIQQALRLEPNNMLALFLGGGEAFEGGRYGEAAALWERLLPQLEPGGEDAQMVEASILKARSRSGGARMAAAAPGATQPGAVMPQDDVHRGVGKAVAPTAPNPASAVGGRVELAPALKAKVGTDDVVFVFARAVDGPRMPLAAMRARAADLPLEFTLGDGQALMPEATLSSAQQVHIEVRISKTGKATPGKGDLTGKSAAVKPGTKGLRIVVDKIDS